MDKKFLGTKWETLRQSMRSSRPCTRRAYESDRRLLPAGPEMGEGHPSSCPWGTPLGMGTGACEWLLGSQRWTLWAQPTQSWERKDRDFGNNKVTLGYEGSRVTGHLFRKPPRTKGERLSRNVHRDFPGGEVVKTPHSQCRGPGFDPQAGN